MANKRKRPPLTHCKVARTTHPKAPWRVSWPVERDGQTTRIRKSFAHEDAAWKFAEDQERDINNHGVRFGELPPEARRAFDFYRDQRVELEAEGATVPTFEQLVTEALATVRKNHAARLETALTVADAVAAFTQYKKTRVGTRQLVNLTDQLKRFAQTFGTRTVPTITTAEIEAWLLSLRSRKNPDKLAEPPLVGPLTRNHYRATVRAFFEFGTAAARQWCDRNPLVDLEPESVKAEEPEAYSPEDTAKILQAALDHRPDVLPVLALGFFGGLRVSEAVNVDLAKLTPGTEEFRVTGKTGPRQAPFTPACDAWIQAQERRKGKAWPQSLRMLVDAVQAVLVLAKVDQIKNGARHSFISYRTAELRDVARVADECGNSVGTIKAHYRQLVTAEAAGRYFAIRPPSAPEAGKVVALEGGRASA
jgi:integrase